MARGPFQGNFAPNARPTIITAPDAMVFINGETDIIGCQSCKRKFDLGKYITQVQVNLSVDSVPGTASITMTIPIHVVDDFYFDGNPVITSMMEVEIYSKGYYLLEGIPQYYPIFWGIITEVGAGYSSGEHTVTIQCADILKWWEICMMNISPAFTAANPQLGRSIYGNTLYGTNVYDLIYTLANMAFGDIIVATGSLTSLNKEDTQKETFNAALGDIMLYWQSRFSKIRSNLLLYGVNGIAVRGDSIAHSYDSGKFTKGKQTISNAVRTANGGNSAAQLIFDPTDPNVTAFRTQFQAAGEVEFWQSDFQSKLEIANACKTAVGFEFYMDVTGDIVFKPPFFNLDILANKPISWIQPIDIIDYDITDSESGVITQLVIQGNFGGNIDYGFGAETTPFTSVTDYHLLRKYGWRSRPYNSEFMGDTMRMFYHGLDILDRINSDRVQMTITIPHRPELRLGFPVYVSHLDQIWYVKGISHSIAFGGRATTSLSLTARRGKFTAPKGISTLRTGGSHDITSVKANTKNASNKVVPTDTGKPKEPLTVRKLAQTSFNLDLGDAATVPPISFDPNDPKTLDPYQPLILRHPKTGRIMGYPNVVMVYTRPYDPKVAYSNIAGEKDKNPVVPKNNQAKVAQRKAVNKQIEMLEHQPDTVLNLKNKYEHNRFSYGLNSAGVYVYAQDVDKSIKQFALLPFKNITVTKDGAKANFSETGIKLDNPNTMVRPVSDERGFEVIGHFRYGRGVSLRDGSLIINGDHNEGANVGTQLALGGDLFATLTAQSQGLTAITTAYSNPSDTVARLMPEDLQTAASLVPGSDGMKAPAFSDVGTNFVDAAPLGSPEVKGFPTSVEASQLSRALTLAEMTVRSDQTPGDKNCQCQAGRADLAFISVGYQVSPINQSTTTSGETLSGSSTASSQTTDENGHPIRVPTEADSVILNNQDKPIPSGLKSADFINKVETYLFNLYQTLDTPHQQLENQLRGDPSGLEPDIRKTPDLFTNRDQDQAFGNFAPPFSSSNRAALGDPIATAQQGVSSRTDIASTFSTFGSNLKKNTQKAQLTQQIADLNSKVYRLNARLTAITTQGTTTLGSTDTVASLQQQISDATQDMHNKQAQLALLG